MTLLNRLQAAWRGLGQFANAMDYDPVDGLRGRIARLEWLSEADPE